MSRLLLACLCGAAAHGDAPTTLCGIPDSAIECLRSSAVLIGGTVDDDDVAASRCWRGRAYATPEFSAAGIFVANDKTIRDAVSLWCSNRTAAEATYGHISAWATSGVTNMAFLFCVRRSWMEGHTWDAEIQDVYRKVLPYFKDACVLSSPSFDDDIGAWDTSSVTSMHAMFYGAAAFNHPLSNWTVDKVTNMDSMFSDAESFDQPIGDWSVDRVTNMYGMFAFATSFDQPLSEWPVDNVADTSLMFFGASAFNQPLNDWRIDGVMLMDSMFQYASAFDQDLGWCVADNVRQRYAFEETKCESTSCGVNRPRCQKHSKNKNAKAKKERNVALIIASVLFACLLLLGCVLGSYRRKQQELELERSEIVQEQCNAARDQVQEFQAHFVTIAGPRFLAFDRLRPHEECRDELIVYDLVAEVRDASTRGEIFIFFSHQWLGWREPDPQRIHVKAMQQAVRAVSTDTDTPLEKIRVWVDYVSIPQKNLRERALAIASLPTFASVSDMFVVIAPNATHSDACCPCDSRTYRRRAWCRAEIFACWARNGTSDMYYNTNAGLKPLVVSDEILHEALDVMSGEFTSVPDQNFTAPSC